MFTCITCMPSKPYEFSCLCTSDAPRIMAKCQKVKAFISAAVQLFLSLTHRHSSHNLSPFVICCFGTSYLACQQNDKLSAAMGVTSTASTRIRWTGIQGSTFKIRHKPLWKGKFALVEWSITQNENKPGEWRTFSAASQPSSNISINSLDCSFCELDWSSGFCTLCAWYHH